MAFTEDPAPFYADFGIAATVGGVSCTGLFDNGHAAAFDVAGTAPSLLLPDSSAASAAHGTAVTVGGHSYTVAAIEPDGTGMTLLRLEAA
jgi:hypothetical protein